MEAEMLGWREAILFLVGTAVLYLLVTVIRLLRVGKRPAATLQEEPPLAEPAVPEATLPPEPGETFASSPDARRVERQDAVDLDLGAGPAPVSPSVADSSPPVSGFGEQLAEHLARSDLEREVRQLRKEVGQLRAELDDLRAMRNISPHYAEALALAQRGLTAQDVADRMGISLAEAELVHALSRGGSLFEEGEQDGADCDDGETRDAGRDRYEPGLGFEPRRSG